MIVKIIKSYRDKDLELALIPGSRNNTEVLVNVSDERGNQLIEAGVAEKYTVAESKDEEINVLEAEPPIVVDEVKAEATAEEAPVVEETKEEVAEAVEVSAEEVKTEEAKKNNSKKANK